MPHVDLYSTGDFASIFYVTNSPFGNVSGFDPEKQTVIILHPLFLDTQWLENHWGDPRLYNNFNLIAFDMRCAGRSACRPSGRHDSWVEAADLALCHLKLRLPPCHVLALEPISVCCALRFAVLKPVDPLTARRPGTGTRFPEMCLSLALCNTPSPSEPRSAFTILNETMERWCFATNMQTFEHAGLEAVNMLMGPDCDPALQDELIAYWATKTPPCQRLRVAECVAVYANRTPLEPDVLAQIKQPVLIIHGERNEMHALDHAAHLKDLLTGVEGGAILFTIVGGSSNLSLNPGSASILNRVYSRFLLERVARTRPELQLPEISIEQRMQDALTNLADIVGRPGMADNDPLSSMSFSCLSEEGIQRQTSILGKYALESDPTFSPLGPDGRPLRKYSKYRSRQWFDDKRDDSASVMDVATFLGHNKSGVLKEKAPGRLEVLVTTGLRVESSTPSLGSSDEFAKVSLAGPPSSVTTLGRVLVT